LRTVGHHPKRAKLQRKAPSKGAKKHSSKGDTIVVKGLNMRTREGGSSKRRSRLRVVAMVGALLAALCFFKHLADAVASCTSQRLFVRLFVRLGLGRTVGLDCFRVCQRCKWTVLVLVGWHWHDELKRGCHLVRRGWAVCETATK
jgi:hypothetical protein